jgi:hypothetical protein
VTWSRNNCHLGNAICITYVGRWERGPVPACLFRHRRHILCPLWLHHIFWHYLTNGTISEKKIKYKMRVLIFYTTLLETFLILREIQRDIVINVKTSLCTAHANFCRILTKLEFPRQIFEKVSNTKYYQNPSNGSRVVPCGQTDTTKQIVAFSNFCDRA